MARLVRLAAGALFATLVLAAFAALGHGGERGPAHNVCIHDKLQRRVVEATAATPHTAAVLSSVGLPYVSLRPDTSTVGTTNPGISMSSTFDKFRITSWTADLSTTDSFCAYVGQTVNNHRGDNVTCTAADILTDAKRYTLVNYLLPEAIQLHKDRLQVKRVKDVWRVDGMNRTVCKEFLVPVFHRTYGVSQTDFMLYVASVPAEDGVAAWAITCQVFANNRPAVGVLNVPAKYINTDYDQYMIHTIAHEIAHALGFSSTFFSNAAMVTSITGIRGKDYAAPVVNGTTVVAKTREHYNCSTAQFMELEDKDPTGQSGSHWKTRNAQDELMAPVMNIGYYTALTMAAFEDLGFYKAVYSKAENASWGRDAGCSFLDGKCVIDGTTKFPSMFCDKEERVFRCTPGRLGMGRCALKTYDVSLASYFQYFSTPTEGGLYDYYDYCPNVVMWDDFGSCTQDATVAGDNVSVFNVFSMSARCIDGNFTPKEKAGAAVTGYYGMCVSVMCDTQLGNYKIKVHGDKKYRPCSAGQKLTLASVSDSFEAGGYITCPSYGELCQSNPQADADYQASVDAAAAPRTAMIVLVMLVLAMIRA